MDVVDTPNVLKRKREDETVDEEDQSRSISAKVAQVLKKHRLSNEPFPYDGLSETESNKVKKLLVDNKNFTCSLSRGLLSQPVCLQEYPERVYDRQYLTSWLKSNDSEPTTGKPLKNKTIVTSRFAQSVLEDYKQMITQKGLKIIQILISENRGLSVCVKLLDRCLQINDGAMFQTKAVLLTKKLQVYKMQQKPIEDLLGIQILITEAYSDKGDISKWASSLEEIITFVNSREDLFPVYERDSDDESSDDEDEAFSHKMESFLDDCLDIIRTNSNIQNRKVLTAFSEYCTKRKMMDEVQLIASKVIETRDTVNSYELFKITNEAFHSHIAHHRSGREANSIRASDLIVMHIEWQEKMKELKYDIDPAISVDVPATSKEITVISIPSDSIVTRLKEAIDLHGGNIKAYELLIHRYQQMVTDSFQPLSDSSLYMINSLIEFVRNSKEAVSKKKCRSCEASSKYELKLFNTVLRQHIGKEEESIVTLKLKDMETYPMNSLVVSKTFNLCGFDFRIEIYPTGTTTQDKVACFLRCIPEFESSLQLHCTFQVQVFDPAESDQSVDPLILIPSTTATFKVNIEDESKSRIGQIDAIPCATLNDYRAKNNDCMFHITVKLKSGLMD